MGETHLLHIRDEDFGQLPIGEPAPPLRGPASRSRGAPRRSRQAIQTSSSLSRLHPVAVRPFGIVQVPHDGSAFRPKLRAEAIRIGFCAEKALVAGFHLELVHGPFPKSGNEDFPDPRGAPDAHHVASSVPLIEIADNAHPDGIRRPDGKEDAVDALHRSFRGRRAFRTGCGAYPRP